MNRLLNCDKYLWDYPLNYGSKLLPIQSCTVQLVKIVSYRWMCLNLSEHYCMVGNLARTLNWQF